MKTLVTINTFSSFDELSIVREKLELEGIETFFDDEMAEEADSDDIYGNEIFELKVADYDVDLALSIISETAGNNINSPALSGFWKHFLIFTNDLPFFNRINPIYSFMILVTAMLTFAICIIYLALKPTTEEMLIGNTWCFDYMIYQDARYEAHTVYYGRDSLLKELKIAECDNAIHFFDNHTITLPGFNSSEILGNWQVDGNYVVFSYFSAFKNVFERKYHVEEIKNGMMLTSDSSVIVLRHPPPANIPLNPGRNLPPSPYGRRGW